MSNKYYLTRAPLLILAIGISACAIPSQEDASKDRENLPSWQQCHESNGKYNPCQVSMYSLLARPREYDGLYIQLVGFYPSAGARTIFINSESAATNDTLSSLLMDDDKSISSGYYKMTGRFSFDMDDAGLASGSYRQAGRLYEADVFEKVPLLWKGSDGCSEDCNLLYANGVYPVIKHEEEGSHDAD